MSEVPVHQKKQYLLMVDEVWMAVLAKFCPAFAFVPVEGMPLENNPGYQVLVSPISKPAAEAIAEQKADATKMVEEPPVA